VVAAGLSIPWAVAFAPDGRIFITERAGRLRVIENGELRAEPLAVVPVEAIGEGGLMGLALDPAFADNGRLYLMYTYSEGGQIRNRVSRFTLTGAGLVDEVALVDAIPGARFHNGGRLAIGPDGKLYAGTGDALVPQLAQDLDSLAGKILRINLDGSIPEDNPFPGSPVYSLGHRNPQGLAFQPETGVLFAVEHGPSGEFGLCCRDELNRIVPGGNYGWPYVSGTDVVDAAQAAAHDLVAPVSSSGRDTWAPAGLAFYDGGPLADWQGDLFFGALRGQHLRRVVLSGDDLGQLDQDEALYSGAYGRIREALMGPDGYLYLTTSNRDGRGNPAADDDRLLRIGVGE
jgi:glucose/arabinose dehydrogenase